MADDEETSSEEESSDEETSSEETSSEDTSTEQESSNADDAADDADDDAADADDDDDVLDGDDDESVLEGDDELDANEKAMLDDLDDDLDDGDDDDEDDEVSEDEIAEPIKPISEKEQRRAGWGCLILLIAIPLGVWYGAQSWLASALELDQSGVPDWYLEASQDDAGPRTATGSFVPPADEVEWLTDPEAAVNQAQESEDPLIVMFSSDNEESQRMNSGTWLNRNVVRMLQDTVPLRLELGDESHDWAERFEVTRAPTILFLSPDLERLRPDTARLVDANDMEIYLYETQENLEEERVYQPADGEAEGLLPDETEDAEDEPEPEQTPSEGE